MAYFRGVIKEILIQFTQRVVWSQCEVNPGVGYDTVVDWQKEGKIHTS